MTNREYERVLGQFGRNRDDIYARWDNEYGTGNWAIGWQLADGTLLDFEHMLRLYTASYVAWFRKNPDQAIDVTTHFAYAYDKNLVTYEEAFDARHLLDKPGYPNQFHHVAMNRALVHHLGYVYVGSVPLMVRSGKQGTPEETWPKGWRWSPGRIPAVVRRELFPHIELTGWWDDGSIEDLYQKAKVLVV